MITLSICVLFQKYHVISPPCILGRYDTEHMAARAYDLAALKYRGLATYINFSVSVMQNFHTRKLDL